MCRIERDGTQEGKQFTRKEAAHPAYVRWHPVRSLQKPDTFFSQFRDERLIQDDILFLHQLVREGGDASQEFRGREPVGASLLDSVGDLLFEPGHSNFEELVEIGAHDAEIL